MRIFWIGKAAADGLAGDEIFDRKTIAALRRQGHMVTALHPSRVSRLRETVNLLAGLPHYRSRFASSRNSALVHAAGASFDLSICSWEPLDILAGVMPAPRVLIAHNITSLALPSMFPASRLAHLAARRAAAWECRTYTREHLASIAVLSRADRDYVASLPDAPPVLLTVPGMPPRVALADSAGFLPELVVSGTFDWRPKRRDAIQFLQEYSTVNDRLPLFGDALPDAAAYGIAIGPPPDDAACSQAIRLGLITDRFTAGHKLKTLAYIARNQIVLSFSDVSRDFEDIPDSRFFLRQLHGVSGIMAIAREFQQQPAPELLARFLRFQQRCAETFSWDDVAARLAACV